MGGRFFTPGVRLLTVLALGGLAAGLYRMVFGLAAAGLTGLGLLVALEAVLHEDFGSAPGDFGTIESVGMALFGGAYLLPFEIASALLTVAMIGAVVLAKREI